MLKKFGLTLSVTAIILFPLSTQGAGASSPASYPSPVQVQIYNDTSFIVYNGGLYELQNLQTGEKVFLQPNTNVSFNKNGTSLVSTLNNLKFSSNKGFRLQEIIGGNQIHNFSSDTKIHKSASHLSNVATTAKKGESVEHIGIHTATNGDKWFKVKNARGIIGWVSRSSTYEPIEAPSFSTITVNGKKYRGSLMIDANGKVINHLDMENYLKGVVPNEMPASWEPNALEAQAIVARSFALKAGNTLSSGTMSQVYRGYSSETSRSSAAVDATTGIVVRYGGKPVQTFFFSTSGGKTANVSDVWNSSQSAFPYLVSVESPDETSPYNSWTEKLSARRILNNFGYGSDTVLFDVKLYKPGQNGEVRGATLITSEGTKSFSNLNELDIRKYFQTDKNLLRSNWFDLNLQKTYNVQNTNEVTSQFGIKGQLVQLNGKTNSISTSLVNIQTTNGIISQHSDPATITATGKGWGHRIGMSQYGAQAMAKKGVSGINIVKHYFPGTTVSK
ncbi:SpoIID/LytB domain-containing protein [Fictibacillus sp. JL2B1089]|uniref:SpoIID/LytB domain-containing protein n=1 Tax=Fictibacillus sp. JL2B1089 TaxID=3399565 RepID=UPI003A894637